MNARPEIDDPAGEVDCPLCGTRFPGKASCPAGCPLAHGCRTLCCPNCHYRFVLDSTVVRWVRKLLPGART